MADAVAGLNSFVLFYPKYGQLRDKTEEGQRIYAIRQERFDFLFGFPAL